MQKIKKHNIMLIISVLVFETVITVLLVYSFLSLNLFLIAHLLCITSILIIIISDIKKNRVSGVLFFLIILTSLLGFLGSLMVLIIIIVHRYILKDSKSVIDNIKEIMNEDYYSESEALYNRLTFIKDSTSKYTNSEPFIDIMRYGSFYEKQQVLILVKRYFRPEFANILFNSLRNADNSIRIEAASLVSSLEKEASDKLKALKIKHIEENNILSIGEEYLNFYEYYIETGILVNSEYSKTFFNRIQAKIKELEKDEKNDFYINILLSKILFKQRKFVEVIAIIDNKVELKHLIDDLKALEIFMESLYIEKKFSVIRNLTKKVLSEKQINIQDKENIISILKYWTK